MARPWQRPYNGFSWSERCAVTPMQNRALRAGLIVRPVCCAICGDARSDHPQGRDYRFLHLEDYREPLRFYGCCKADHAALHARFDDPARWRRVIERHGRPGAWFLLLTLDPASQWRPFDETYPEGLPFP